MNIHELMIALTELIPQDEGKPVEFLTAPGQWGLVKGVGFMDKIPTIFIEEDKDSWENPPY